MVVASQTYSYEVEVKFIFHLSKNMSEVQGVAWPLQHLFIEQQNFFVCLLTKFK
jgi:hypothetical protein